MPADRRATPQRGLFAHAEKLGKHFTPSLRHLHGKASAGPGASCKGRADGKRVGAFAATGMPKWINLRPAGAVAAFLNARPVKAGGMDTATSYHALKDQLVVALGQSHSMMHIHAGLALYLGAQFVIGTRRASLQALAIVFWAEMANELLDRLATGSWRWADTLSDVVLTLMWPAAITALSLYRRARWERRVRLQRLVLAGSPALHHRAAPAA